MARAATADLEFGIGIVRLPAANSRVRSIHTFTPSLLSVVQKDKTFSFVFHPVYLLEIEWDGNVFLKKFFHPVLISHV